MKTHRARKYTMDRKYAIMLDNHILHSQYFDSEQQATQFNLQNYDGNGTVVHFNIKTPVKIIHER